jgi:hypothetical protein
VTRRFALTFAAAIIAAAAPAALSAQSDAAHLVIYAGYTSATLHGDSVPGPTHTPGFALGVALTKPMSARFAFQPELQFIQKGDDETDSYRGGTFTMHIRLSYLELPLLVRVTGGDLGGITPYLVAGPQIAVKAGCSIVVTGLAGNYTCANLPAAESMDWGAVAGAGLDFSVAGRPLTLSARHDWGLKDAFKDNIAKTRTASVVLGWRIW